MRMYVSPNGVVDQIARHVINGEEVLRLVVAGSQNGLDPSSDRQASISCLVVPKFWILAPVRMKED